MKAVLYVLAGIVAALGLGGAGILSVELANWLFGPVWGIGVWGLCCWLGRRVCRLERLPAACGTRPGAETLTGSPSSPASTAPSRR